MKPDNSQRNSAAPNRINGLARLIADHAPGLLLVLLLALIARSVAPLLPTTISEITIGVVLGLVIGNLWSPDRRFTPGIRFSVAKLLRLGIVFLGARLAFSDVVATGAEALFIVVVSMSVALALSVIVGRALKVPPRLALLIGVGTAVCGNSAIVATAPVIKAEDREVSFAVATITLFGVAAVLLYPLIGEYLNMSARSFGHWAGVAIHDTSQVTAAGFSYSTEAGETATIVKLVRNTLMGPLIVGIGLLSSRSGGSDDRRTDARAPGLLKIVPLFVLGFLALALLNSVRVIPSELSSALTETAKFLILLALVAVGLNTNLREMRAVGLRPLYLGLGVTAFLAGFGFLLVNQFVSG